MAQIDASRVAAASRLPVVSALSTFSQRSPSDWLGANHRAQFGRFLRNNGADLQDYRWFSRQYTPRELAETLAAVGPNHCMDGWSYLARSIDALLHGSPHSSRHLAYYAQLRAAKSILALSGIGVFNTLNFALRSNGGLLRLENVSPSTRGVGTHKAVWDSIHAWSQQSALSEQFLRSITIAGVSFFDCVQSIWPSAPAGALVYELVHAWGIDLRRAGEDRDARNTSSYTPHLLNPISSDIAQRLALIQALWNALEPSGGDGFAALDRHLLRHVLQRNHQRISPRNPFSAGAIARRYDQLHPLVQPRVSLDFLLGNDDPNDPPIVAQAKSRSLATGEGMICRALLLLRAATGVARRAFVDAGFTPLENHIAEWMAITGEERGFWNATTPPAQMADLWAEIQNAIDDLVSSISSNPSTQYDWIGSAAPTVRYLSQAERACMWGMCS